MKLKKNNKGFALAEILAVTLVLMVIFTVLYSNFMPLAGEYEKNISYKDVSSQYTLHYFKKMLLTKVDKSALTLDNKKFKVLDSSICNSDASCTSLFNTFNPYLILTKYNINELKSDIANTTDETLKEFSSYIKSSPNYSNRDDQEEVYRLMIKTDSGYATSALFDVQVPEQPTPTGPLNATEFAEANVNNWGLEEVSHGINDTLQVNSNFTTEYRYRGGDSVVKNYVTFNNEVWRIIGIIPTEDIYGKVENRFKLIRNESIGNYMWNEGVRSNDWTGAKLNAYLNTDDNSYYKTLNTEAQNMIGTTKYYLGGYRALDKKSDEMWQYERKKANDSVTYYYGTNSIMQNDSSKKIALMYLSDYGYGASKECQATFGNYGNDDLCKKTNNWIHYQASAEWCLDQGTESSMNAYIVNPSGMSNSMGIVNLSQNAVRPVLSLNSNVKIVDGDGTSESPYQLGV